MGPETRGITELTTATVEGACLRGNSSRRERASSTSNRYMHPLRDFHVTQLRLLGLDDNKLTYFHSGCFKQLMNTNHH
jgi:hypothetical protein